MELLILFVISFVANLFSAFSGGGAGLVQLPALIFLGLPFGIALATHKVASVALGIGATFRHAREKSLDKKLVVYILLTGMPGVILGANLILQIDDRLAEIALGILTLSLGVYSIFKKNLGQTAEEKNRDLNGYLVGGVVLFAIGILNGSLTSGTGLFVTLWLIRWFGLDYKMAVTYTLILVGMFWNGSGAITLGILGEIKWDWLPVLIAGSLLGGYAGAHLAITKGNKWIKRGFETVAILIGTKLIFG
jgi:uncharacterized protein